MTIPDTLEVYKCMALSTSHLTYSMTEQLQHIADHTDEPNILAKEFGFFVKLYSSDGEVQRKDYDYFRYPNKHSWIPIIDFAIANNFQLIEFDRDAGTIDELPTYEW